MLLSLSTFACTLLGARVLELYRGDHTLLPSGPSNGDPVPGHPPMVLSQPASKARVFPSVGVGLDIVCGFSWPGCAVTVAASTMGIVQELCLAGGG